MSLDYNEMSDPCKVWWENSTDSNGRMILFVRERTKTGQCGWSLESQRYSEEMRFVREQ